MDLTIVEFAFKSISILKLKDSKAVHLAIYKFTFIPVSISIVVRAYAINYICMDSAFISIAISKCKYSISVHPAFFPLSIITELWTFIIPIPILKSTRPLSLIYSFRCGIFIDPEPIKFIICPFSGIRISIREYHISISFSLAIKPKA